MLIMSSHCLSLMQCKLDLAPWHRGQVADVGPFLNCQNVSQWQMSVHLVHIKTNHFNLAHRTSKSMDLPNTFLEGCRQEIGWVPVVRTDQRFSVCQSGNEKCSEAFWVFSPAYWNMPLETSSAEYPRRIRPQTERPFGNMSTSLEFVMHTTCLATESFSILIGLLKLILKNEFVEGAWRRPKYRTFHCNTGR